MGDIIRTVKLSNRVSIHQISAKRWLIVVDGQIVFKTHKGEKRATGVAKSYMAGHKS